VRDGGVASDLLALALLRGMDARGKDDQRQRHHAHATDQTALQERHAVLLFRMHAVYVQACSGLKDERWPGTYKRAQLHAARRKPTA
jgi:hypothetical protein